MDVFDIRDQVVSDYQSFTTSFVEPRDPRIADYLQQELESEKQWPDPWLSDFIILDEAGTYWVAEGKANSEMTDETVLAKRDAATRWVDAVNGSDAVPQRWAYLLASETAIANASGWPQLLAASFTHR